MAANRLTPVEQIKKGDVIAWKGRDIQVAHVAHRYSRYDELEAIRLDLEDGTRKVTWTKFPGDTLALRGG